MRIAIVGFDVLGANNGTFKVQFFDFSGTFLEEIELAASNSSFAFESQNSPLIAGMTITNLDQGGLAYNNFRFESVKYIYLGVIKIMQRFS